MDHLDTFLSPFGLMVLGTCPVLPADALPDHLQSLALIGPAGREFWPLFQAAPETQDGQPDPLDRWSARVIGGVATQVHGQALFPFGGPPWRPFINWALRSDQVFTSPVSLLVHRTQGLFVSFRGAIGLPRPCATPPEIPSPCESCSDQPCRTACPVGALGPKGYDVPACHTHLDQPQGHDCLSGCRVRRACPVGQGLRPVAQSAFHMASFHRSPT